MEYSVSALKKIRSALQNDVARLEKECVNLQKQIPSLQDELKETQASSELNRGLRSSCGAIIPMVSFSQVNTEDSKTKSTATFRIFKDGLFSITVLSNEEQEIVKVDVDISQAPELWEIRNQLMNLLGLNNPQSIIFDIIAFKDIEKFRQSTIHMLLKACKGFHVIRPQTTDSHDRSPIIKAFNSSTSEIYFEVKWCVDTSDEYLTLAHDFRFKCIPQVKEGNEGISSLISNLHETLYWMGNQSELANVWNKIYQWVSYNTSVIQPSSTI